MKTGDPALMQLPPPARQSEWAGPSGTKFCPVRGLYQKEEMPVCYSRRTTCGDVEASHWVNLAGSFWRTL
jgi:hypothetical protein